MLWVLTQKNKLRDGKFVHPKHMLKLMDKKLFTILWVKKSYLDLAMLIVVTCIKLTLPLLYADFVYKNETLVLQNFILLIKV